VYNLKKFYSVGIMAWCFLNTMNMWIPCHKRVILYREAVLQVTSCVLQNLQTQYLVVSRSQLTWL